MFALMQHLLFRALPEGGYAETKSIFMSLAAAGSALMASGFPRCPCGAVRAGRPRRAGPMKPGKRQRDAAAVCFLREGRQLPSVHIDPAF